MVVNVEPGPCCGPLCKLMSLYSLKISRNYHSRFSNNHNCKWMIFYWEKRFKAQDLWSKTIHHLNCVQWMLSWLLCIWPEGPWHGCWLDFRRICRLEWYQCGFDSQCRFLIWVCTWWVCTWSRLPSFSYRLSLSNLQWSDCGSCCTRHTQRCRMLRFELRQRQ